MAALPVRDFGQAKAEDTDRLAPPVATTSSPGTANAYSARRTAARAGAASADRERA